MTTKKGKDYLTSIKRRIEERNAKTSGIKISKWRADHGLTQEKLSEALRVNLYTVKKWEGGDREPIGYLGLALSAITSKVRRTKIDNSEISTSLAQWRKERGFTQETLSEALGVNVYTVKKWEGGSRKYIEFLGLALSAIDANLVPVKVKFERRQPTRNHDNVSPETAPKPF